MLAASWNDHWTPLNSISLISTFRCLYASINTPGLSLIQTCPVPSSQDSVLQLHHHLFAAHSFCIPNQFFFFFLWVSNSAEHLRLSPLRSESARKLSSVCSRNSLDCLHPTVLLFWIVLMGLNFPRRQRLFPSFSKATSPIYFSYEGLQHAFIIMLPPLIFNVILTYKFPAGLRYVPRFKDINCQSHSSLP